MGKVLHKNFLLKLSVILLALFLANVKSNLFFYSLVEVISITVFLSIFLLVWNSRRYLQNNFFVFIGIAYFFVAVFGMIHVLSLKGFNIFTEYGQDLSDKLNLVGRFVLASSFLSAPFFVRRKVNSKLVFLLYLIFTIVILLSIFQWNIFPITSSVSDNKINFKITGEFLTLAALALSLIFLRFKKEYFDPGVLFFLEASIVLNILIEVFLLLGQSTYITNILVYIMMAISAYFGYLGIVEMGLINPYCLFLKELQMQEKTLKEGNERNKALVEFSPHAIFIHDKGRIVYMNPAGKKLCGVVDVYLNETNSIYDFIRADYHSFLAKRFQSLACGNLAAPSSEIKFVKLNGKCIDVEEISVAISHNSKELIYTIIRDISKRKAAQEKIQHMSTYDALTGLYNHFYLERQLQKFRGRREFNGGIIMVDINGLKKVNDSLGHFAGDEVIQNIASYISNEFRQEDVIARVGGDEFCILLPNTDTKMISVVTQRIKTKMDEIKMINPLFPDVSIGSSYAKSGKDIDRAIKIANQAIAINKKINIRNGKQSETGEAA